ncbi:hypothetical protein CBR_g38180 [Chara braunii]|uniref:Uncharacterized protein n=1 Tax=Chara braunii TaxID=69332 RepID=A0A388LPF0_CHABU|nr:hypothetical protein CBR_g38180 [Chara braunii]|eukprot:GBG84208.1 hypothetical protein CBR_g38180 [Chara braunii]
MYRQDPDWCVGQPTTIVATYDGLCSFGPGVQPGVAVYVSIAIDLQSLTKAGARGSRESKGWQWAGENDKDAGRVCPQDEE